MCGIFGFVSQGKTLLESGRLIACTEMLAHRGPDGKGWVGWREDGGIWQGDATPASLTMGLGHRRLAIFDLSAAGLQPMKDDRGRWIVFNGEIYNFLELKEELKGLGHSFRTGTDTEVILAAYDQWGRECVRRFNGMWAFAIYDPDAHGMFCSRDRLGVKPFYYVHRDGVFCFASEVHPLFAALDMPVRVPLERLARYLVYDLSDDGPETLYQDVWELRGGHGMWVDTKTGKREEWRYWELPQGPDEDAGDDVVLDRFSELIEDAARLRMRADVPVAVTLSGGTDSSAVTMAARRSGCDRMVVFTSHFPESPSIDETAYAAEVAAACGAEHIRVAPDLSRMVEEEPLLTMRQAMPYWSLSMYVHWAIVREIRGRGIPVFLSGQGGDELFMGYERYYSSYLLHLLPNVPRMVVEMERCGRHSGLGVGRVAVHLTVFGLPGLRGMVRRAMARRVYAREFLSHLPAMALPTAADVKMLQREELLGRQLGQLLRYDDRVCSAHGTEERHPFLDYRLVEFAYRLPWRHKIRDGWTKYLVRRYLDRCGLKSIAWRRHKLGFNAPEGEWMRSLINARGAQLADGDLARRLMRKGPDFRGLTGEDLWDVYNVLHLAHMMKWQTNA